MIDDHGTDRSQGDDVVLFTLNLNARSLQAAAAEASERARRNYQLMQTYGFNDIAGAWDGTLRRQHEVRWAGQRARTAAAANRLAHEVDGLRYEVAFLKGELMHAQEDWG